MKTLDQIMLGYRSDKASLYHNYTPVYQSYFEPFRNNKFVFFELGLGDKKSLNREGEDLLAFQEYFPNAWIVGIDNDANKLYSDKRIRTYCCDQTDANKLKEIIRNEGNPFVIIDDCSHVQSLTIKSFEILFPLLKSGGIYVVEDGVTAFWPSWGGDSFIYAADEIYINTNTQKTIFTYMFQLVYYVNLKRQETFNPPQDIHIPDWIKEIDSIHFHHSQIIIRKK